MYVLGVSLILVINHEAQMIATESKESNNPYILPCSFAFLTLDKCEKIEGIKRANPHENNEINIFLNISFSTCKRFEIVIVNIDTIENKNPIFIYLSSSECFLEIKSKTVPT